MAGGSGGSSPTPIAGTAAPLAAVVSPTGQPPTPTPAASPTPAGPPTASPSPSAPPAAKGETPTPAPVPTPAAAGGTYIALGDSLTVGVGSTPGNSFVALVARALGEGVELLNLGHSGDTSRDLMDHGHLDRALAEIRARNSDGRSDNDVRLVTITIGGNDLLRLFFDYVARGRCASREQFLASQECIDVFRATLAALAANLNVILPRLRQELPGERIVLFTLYNPFSGRDAVIGALGDLALEGDSNTVIAQGVNTVLRAAARAYGLVLADVFPPFEGRGGELIAPDGIHPNDRGYRVMADVALVALGVPAR